MKLVQMLHFCYMRISRGRVGFWDKKFLRKVIEIWG